MRMVKINNESWQILKDVSEDGAEAADVIAEGSANGRVRFLKK